MSTKPIEAFKAVGMTQPIDKASGGPVALSPVYALIAEMGRDYVCVSNYETSEVLSEIWLDRHLPHVLSFSGDGEQLLVISHDGWGVVTFNPRIPGKWTGYSWTYDNSWPHRGDDFLQVFHGAWLDERTAVIAGKGTHDGPCIAIVDDQQLQFLNVFSIVHQGGRQLASVSDENALDGACCSASGMVAFTFGHGQRIELYQLARDRNSVTKRLTLLPDYGVRWGRSVVALDETGETVLSCRWLDYIGAELRLYSRKGELTGYTGITGMGCPTITYHSGIACIRARGVQSSPGKTVDKVSVVITQDESLRHWCSRLLPYESGSGIDLAVQDDRVLVAIEEGDHTTVFELTDYDILSLGAQDTSERSAGAQRLGQRRYQPAVPALVRCLRDESLEVREAAAQALAAIGDPDALPSLIQALGRTTTELAMQTTLTTALRRFQPAQLLPAIAHAAEQPAVSFRRGAVLMCRSIPSLNAPGALIDLLQDIDEGVRNVAAEAMELRKDLRFCLPLLAHLTDECDFVRHAAQSALAATLRNAGLLQKDASGQTAYLAGLMAFAQEVISASRLRDFASFGTPPTGLHLNSLAVAVVQSGQPLPAVLNTVEALAVPRDAGSEPASAALAMTIALACADAMQAEKHSHEAAAIYRRAVQLARQADAPAIEWRIWHAIGQCCETLGDDRAALDAFRQASDVIDRQWFALLEEDKLRNFFADKALLYDQAALCCLRLGYSALALEYNERAKTRYLGDLIARRQMDPHTALDAELREFWRQLDRARPIRLAIGGSAQAHEQRVEIVAVQESDSAPDETIVKPERLAQLEERFEVNSDLRRYRGMIQTVWRLMTYLALNDNEETHERLEDIYQALLPTYQSVKADDLPIPVEEQREGTERFELAALALSRSGNANEAPYWALVEWGFDWLRRIGSTESDPDFHLLLYAVMEALNTVLHHEPVWGIPAELDDQAATPASVFVTRKADARASVADTRTVVVESALERATQTRWRYVTRLARGQTAGYHDLVSALRGHSDTAHLQFTVTDDGTVAYLILGTSDVDTPGGPLPVMRGEEGIQVFTYPDLTMASLRDLLTSSSDSWFPRYRSRSEPGGFTAWLDVMDRTLALLYEQLISPLTPTLKRSGVRHLQIVPHRGLHMVPWAALRTNDATGRPRFLVDEYEISFAPSSTLLEICRERAAYRSQRPSLVAIANPTGDLPLADDEVAYLSQFLPTARQQVWRGDQARRSDVVHAVPSALWHFAGHGRYDWTDPLASCLLFAGREQLPLADLFAEAMSLSETNLVVLSACETDVTDPEDLADEYLGLASGFLFAGASAVISTLWAVDDVSTALLMGKFYEKYLKEQQRPSQALREAQVWLRDKVDAPLVFPRMKAVIERLRQQRIQARSFSEEAEALDRQIKRLDGWLDRLAKRKASHIGDKLFAHPYYWAAFTVAGVEPATDVEQ